MLTHLLSAVLAAYTTTAPNFGAPAVHWPRHLRCSRSQQQQQQQQRRRRPAVRMQHEAEVDEDSSDAPEVVLLEPGTGAVPTALALLAQQQASGAPLDALLAHHVRANHIWNDELAAIQATLERAVRSHARLEWRLRALGVDPSARNRLLASLRLCAEWRVPAIGDALRLDAAEVAWLCALTPPLECAGMPLATRLECPAWAWPRMCAAFRGDEQQGKEQEGGPHPAGTLERQMRALQLPAPLDLRVNTLKGTRNAALEAIRRAGFSAEPTPFSPVGIRLQERAVALGRVPGLLSGDVDVQDEGSQLLALLVGARAGEQVLDYCAGAGGKSLAIAAAMQNKGVLVAADIDETRLGRAAPRFVKAGVDIAQRHVITPGKDVWLKRRKRHFDRVLVDAPCSGLGAWRRNPDARWQRRTRPLEELLPLQADVLQRAARLVRPGGTLVYATCSLLPDENEEQVGRFLASEDGAEFELTPPASFFAPLDGDYLRLSPAEHGCDGFFGAVLTRREGGWSGRGGRRSK
jgi:16S rRNA (cytosine967-C5)-methyltransferase